MLDGRGSARPRNPERGERTRLSLEANGSGRGTRSTRSLPRAAHWQAARSRCTAEGSSPRLSRRQLGPSPHTRLAPVDLVGESDLDVCSTRITPLDLAIDVDLVLNRSALGPRCRERIPSLDFRRSEISASDGDFEAVLSVAGVHRPTEVLLFLEERHADGGQLEQQKTRRDPLSE